MLKMTNQRGSVLLLVQSLIVILILLVSSFSLTLKRQNTVLNVATNKAKLSATCDSWLDIIVYMLRNPDPEKRWQADGKIYQVIRDGVEIRFSILSEDGKINLNGDEDLYLKAVLKAIDSAEYESLLAAIKDWKDSDSLPVNNGAEEEDYLKANLLVLPANRAFITIDELKYVYGMDEHIFNLLSDWVTVHSDLPKIDFSQSAPELIQVFDEYLEKRDDFNSYLDSLSNATPSQQTPSNEVKSNIFTVRVSAKRQSGEMFTIKTIIKIMNDNDHVYDVVEWKEGSRAGSLFDTSWNMKIYPLDNESQYAY